MAGTQAGAGGYQGALCVGCPGRMGWLEQKWAWSGYSWGTPFWEFPGMMTRAKWVQACGVPLCAALVQPSWGVWS